MNYEFDFVPQPGRVLLYVILTEVTNQSIPNVFKRLSELGYTPQLRYWQWGKSPKEVNLYAVLRDEEMPPNAVIGDYLTEEHDAIKRVIEPNSSVRLAWGSVPEQSESA